MVEPNLPAEHAQHQGRGQIAVGGRESVDGLAAQQIVGVGLAALDGHENLEGGLASGRDLGRAILRRSLRRVPEPHCVVPAARRQEAGSAQKLGCREALFAFELHFEKFEPGISGAGRRIADGLRRESRPGRMAGADSAQAGAAATSMR